MSELSTRMDALAAAFAARVPTRVVTRSYRQNMMIPDADLLAGVYALISMGENDFTNAPGYNAMDGVQRVLIIGDIRLAETQTGKDVEDAEFTMIEEVKGLCRNLPADLCVFDLIAWQQSGQQDHPYGWISCSLEYRP